MQNDNRFTGYLPTFKLPASLKTLFLGANKCSGPIPQQWVQGGLPQSLRSLWIYGNGLTGTIPEDWVLPANLSSLFLFRNKLRGTLPPKLRWPPSLQNLDLSYNQLSGPLPAEWALPNIWYAYFYGNMLTGEENPACSMRNQPAPSMACGGLTGLGFMAQYHTQCKPFTCRQPSKLVTSKGIPHCGRPTARRRFLWAGGLFPHCMHPTNTHTRQQTCIDADSDLRCHCMLHLRRP